MDYNELQKYYTEIIKSITDHKLFNAFTLLNKLIKQCSNSDFQNRYDNFYGTYQNILKYSFEYQDDPEKEHVYYRLVRSLIKLADEAREDILYSKKMRKYFIYKDEVSSFYNINEKESTRLVDSIAFEKEIEKILDDSKVFNKGEKNEKSDVSAGQTDIKNIFKYLWLADSYRQVESELVIKIINSANLPWYDKCLIVTAVTLSALRHFDERKLIILFDISESREEEVWQRAFIGLCLNMVFYDNRISLYPEITNRLKILQGQPAFFRNLEMLLLQYIWQKESEKIAKRINDEILPDVMKMRSIIEEKLDLDNITSSDPFKDKNPDWEDYFKDSPGLYKKFEEIQNLQTQGADIFMGSFAMLKQFPFFKEISNWFVPFYAENTTVKEMVNEMNGDPGFKNIINSISSTYFLCNSDKYSFCHNLKFVMQTQKPAVLDMFKMELDAMDEAGKDEEKIYQNNRNKQIFTQYLQDLYRFYMLYPEKYEFENIFNLPMDIYKTGFMKLMAGESKIVHKIGEFYFTQDYYDKALDIFLTLEKEENSTDLLEKIAYCYQRTGNIDNAIQYYNKALLIDKNSMWKLQQLAFCHRKNRDYHKALEYYKEFEKLSPEDLKVQADIGQVYLGLEDYENALKYYFKVEYLDPKNKKVHRPIAWCSFVLGKFDAAKKYFERVIENDKNKNDLINLGHVYWCLGERNEAISRYKEGLVFSKNDFTWFERVMNEDSKHLIKNGIQQLDIFLMTDFIKMGN